MQPYPHVYHASAAGGASGPVTVSTPQRPSLQTSPPPQFGGPEGFWSPEMLLCAALADCFVLTFRAVAHAARFEWQHLECRVQGVLEHSGHQASFTHFKLLALVAVPAGQDGARARSLLQQAERDCLIARSLTGVIELETQVAQSAPV